LKKYSERAKLAAVQAYCSGQLGWKATAQGHDVEVSSLRKWVAAYQVHGVDGVREKRRELYGREFKLKVLQRMRDEDLSYRQAAALFDIRNFNIIGAWERAYERDGMSGLARQWVGRGQSMTNGAGKKSAAPPCEDDKRTRQELQEELNSLRLENAYLKKLDALVQSQAKSAQGKGRKS
jgi:transposase